MGFLQISREGYSIWGFFRSPTPRHSSKWGTSEGGMLLRSQYMWIKSICFVSVPSQSLWFKSLFSTFGLLIVFAGWVDCVLVGGIVNHSSLIPLLIQADLRASHVAHDWSHSDILRGIPTTVLRTEHSQSDTLISQIGKKYMRVRVLEVMATFTIFDKLCSDY